jgi:hypothetical protein
LFPFILATKPMPQESCSKEGWYKPMSLAIDEY